MKDIASHQQKNRQIYHTYNQYIADECDFQSIVPNDEIHINRRHHTKLRPYIPRHNGILLERNRTTGW